MALKVLDLVRMYSDWDYAVLDLESQCDSGRTTWHGSYRELHLRACPDPSKLDPHLAFSSFSFSWGKQKWYYLLYSATVMAHKKAHKAKTAFSAEPSISSLQNLFLSHNPYKYLRHQNADF